MVYRLTFSLVNDRLRGLRKSLVKLEIRYLNFLLQPQPSDPYNYQTRYHYLVEVAILPEHSLTLDRSHWGKLHQFHVFSGDGRKGTLNHPIVEDVSHLPEMTQTRVSDLQ